MLKKIINITDITEYLYCPRKVYLKLVKGFRAQPSQRMINGMLRHKVFDLFNKNESALVSSMKQGVSQPEIKKVYENFLAAVSKETYLLNESLARKFGIQEKELESSVKETLAPEISLRTSAVASTIARGFSGKELWRELKPKFLTEFKLESPELGLRGRVDRVEFSDSIIPFEIKTRDRVFESDKIQLAGYALLLESEFSKPVNFGVIEVLGTKQQVEITPELKTQVLEIAEKIRSLSEETAQFPSNFAKCKNCEFKSECYES